LKIFNVNDLSKSNNINYFLNKMFCGDCRELMDKLPKNSIDLVITSPPYDDLRDYENQIVWNFDVFKKVARRLYRVLKPGGVIVWVVGDRTLKGAKSLTGFKQALYFEKVGFSVYDVIIYEKTGSGPPHPRRYFNSFEYMFILSKGKIKTVHLLKDKLNKWGGAQTFGEITRREKDGTLTKKGRKTINKYGRRSNIWRYTNGKGFSAKEGIAYQHPAIFPEKLVEDHIKSWSDKGSIVLDIFGGSGTTAKVSICNNRNWIYCDKVEKYCEIAKKRLTGVLKKSK